MTAYLGGACGEDLFGEWGIAIGVGIGGLCGGIAANLIAGFIGYGIYAIAGWIQKRP